MTTTTSSRRAPRVLWVDGDEGVLPQSTVLQSLLAGEVDSVFGEPFDIERAAGLDPSSAQPLTGADAVVLRLSADDVTVLPQWPALPSLCAESAVVVLTPTLEDALMLRLLQAGVQDVVLWRDSASLPHRLALAMERKRIETALLKSHATDLKTGLPNRQQLIEHMSQLMALRERERRPVSVLVLRIDGLEGVESGHGEEAANVVRRKVAVRLRAGVRASDVVASLGANVFAVLLPVIESPADVPLVVDKLLRAVRQPFSVAGSSVRLSASAGAAQFPDDGQQPEALLRHAAGLALLGGYEGQQAAND